jgi:hypothetical protein
MLRHVLHGCRVAVRHALYRKCIPQMHALCTARHVNQCWGSRAGWQAQADHAAYARFDEATVASRDWGWLLSGRLSNAQGSSAGAAMRSYRRTGQLCEVTHPPLAGRAISRIPRRCDALVLVHSSGTCCGVSSSSCSSSSIWCRWVVA